MTEHYEQIRLDLIDEDVDNHRLLHDAGDDDKLCESIEREGLQQPIKVCTKPDGRYTLVFGFRRKKAVAALGHETIAAAVVEGLAPSEIRKLQALENLDRRELHPLEEAQFCQDLAEQYDPLRSAEKTEAAFVAAAIGRPVKWVENRLALSRLSERVKHGFLAGDITLTHARLIAQLVSHEAQEEVFGRVKSQQPPYVDKDNPEARRPPETIAETRRLVEQRLRNLADVDWLLDLPFGGKVACTECPHNSANRGELFDGDQPKQPKCLDAVCFEEKRKFTMRAAQKATNTAVKNGAKPTVTGVAEALEEREAAFVKPEVVAKKVKYAKKPASAKTKTTAERRGEHSREREHKINHAYHARLRAWLEPIVNAIAAKIHADKWARLMLILMESTFGDAPNLEGNGKQAKALQAEFKKMAGLLAKPSEKNFLSLAKAVKLHPPHKYDRPFELSPHYDEPFIRQTLCEVLGITVTDPMPDKKAIELELFQPAAKADDKKPAKKKAKRKAAAKSKKKARKKR